MPDFVAEAPASSESSKILLAALSTPQIRIRLEGPSSPSSSSTAVELSVHSGLLRFYSGYFSGLLSSGLREALLIADGQPITLHDIESPSTAKLLFNFCYTRSLPLTPENVLPLLKLAEFLMMPLAIKTIENFLEDNLNVETCCQFLQQAALVGLSLLYTKSLDLARSRVPEVSQTAGFLELDLTQVRAILTGALTKSESEALDAFLRWHAASSPAREPAENERILLEACGLELCSLSTSVSFNPQVQPLIRLPHLPSASLDSLLVLLRTFGPRDFSAVLTQLRGSDSSPNASGPDGLGGRPPFDPRPFVNGGTWSPLLHSTKREGHRFDWGAENPKSVEMHQINAGDAHPGIGLVATGMKDGQILITDLPTGKPIRTLTDAHHNSCIIAVAFSPDGKWLATGSEGRVCTVHWMKDNCPILVLQAAHDLEITGCCFSHDSKYFFTSSFDGTVRVYHITTLDEAERAPPLPFPAPFNLRPGLGLGGFDQVGPIGMGVREEDLEEAMMEVEGQEEAPAPAAQPVILGVEHPPARTPYFKHVALIDVDESHDETPGAMVGGINCHPKKLFLATTISVRPNPGTDVWDLTQLPTIRHVGFAKGHSDGAWQVAWTPDGKFLASASFDHTIRLYNGDSLEPLFTLGHLGQVLSLSFSPCGNFLASTSRDGYVTCFDIPSGRPFGKSKHLAFGQRAPPPQDDPAWKHPDSRVEGFEVRIVASSSADRERGKNEDEGSSSPSDFVQVVAWASNRLFHLLEFSERDEEAEEGAG